MDYNEFLAGLDESIQAGMVHCLVLHMADCVVCSTCMEISPRTCDNQRRNDRLRGPNYLDSALSTRLASFSFGSLIEWANNHCCFGNSPYAMMETDRNEILIRAIRKRLNI